MLKHLKKRIYLLFAVIGPGFIVMLADTDVGSLVVAAQSGAVWGYKLLLIQIILIPILYITQELAVRLGMVTHLGHGELIKKYFGEFWAWVSVSTLVICCTGAIITELSGIASIGLLFGMPAWLSMLLTITFLTWLVITRSYYTVEKVALAIGIFEVIYLVVAWLAQPSLPEIAHNMLRLPLHQPQYLYLTTATIGAVIMPWMIFYQQSAIADKKLKVKHLKAARHETFYGAILTQIIMISVLVAVASTIGRTNPGTPLTDVNQISDAITPYLGYSAGRILFSLGMLGAALVATIVVSLTAAWGIGEVTGIKHSLQDNAKEAPWFYGSYIFIILFGALVVTSKIDLVNINVAIQVMNGMLLPIVLGFLYLLARKALPDRYRLKGWYAVVVALILGITSLVAVVTGIIGIFV